MLHGIRHFPFLSRDLYEVINMFFKRLHGHQKLKEFILSQHPLKDYFEDFWRMLWDHNAQTVVLLSTVDNEV